MTKRWAAALLALASMGAACGGDDSASPATTTMASTPAEVPAAVAKARAGIPDEPTSWAEVDERLAAVAEQASILAAEVADDGSLDVVHALGAEVSGPIGSIFKLYVLGAVVEAVRAGELAWDDPLTVEAGDISFAGGPTTPAGAVLAVRAVAQQMISISDNTAADLLLRTVGRPAVEAMLEPMGMGEDSRARTLPFLSAAEAFKVKWGTPAATYPSADTATRRAILAGLDEPVPDPLTIDPSKPAQVDRVEWFASAEEVAAAHAWLAAARAEGGPDGAALEEILERDNPGLALDPAHWAGGAFKGGSEPGVLALSWRLDRDDGRRFVVVVLLSDTAEVIEDAEGASIGWGSVDLLAALP